MQSFSFLCHLSLAFLFFCKQVDKVFWTKMLVFQHQNKFVGANCVAWTKLDIKRQLTKKYFKFILLKTFLNLADKETFIENVTYGNCFSFCKGVWNPNQLQKSASENLSKLFSVTLLISVHKVCRVWQTIFPSLNKISRKIKRNSFSRLINCWISLK